VRLTRETIEDVVDLVGAGERSLDLRGVTSMDAYALLLLDLVVRDARESGRPLQVAWPEAAGVRTWMAAMGFFADVKSGLASRTAEAPTASNHSPSDARGTASGGPALAVKAFHPLTTIEREDDVSRLVGAFDERLSDRFPIDESPRRRFLRILFELFQNIPQHANAADGTLDPHGLAALEDDGASIHLAVADKGIGLARSLGLGRRTSQALASDRRPHLRADADALRAVVFDGRSRFRDPGRGHELERIVRLVRSWEGAVCVRSGGALLYQSDLGGDIVEVAPFPGVQILLSIPRAAFGIGEAAFGEHGVEPSGDPGFNEQSEEDDD
jgi:hypothetical protein